MSLTSFSGPVGTYTQQSDGVNHSDLGLAELTQAVTLSQNSTTAVTAVVYLPQNSSIVDIIADTLTQWDSATSATLSAGTAAAGTQYVSGVNAKTAGRQTPSYTSAQLTAMANIGTSVAVYITVTVVGATTAGNTRVTVRYIQNQ